MPRRTDSNQKSIVAALRDCGCTIQILSDVGGGCPDIIAGRGGFNVLMEIKDGSKSPSQQKLTEHEQIFFNTWKGQVCIVRSEMEAIEAINAIVKKYCSM